MQRRLKDTQDTTVGEGCGGGQGDGEQQLQDVKCECYAWWVTRWGGGVSLSVPSRMDTGIVREETPDSNSGPSVCNSLLSVNLTPAAGGISYP